jgi:hypothetical protein
MFDQDRFLDETLRRLDTAHKIMAAQVTALGVCHDALLRARAVVHEAPVAAAIDRAIAEIVS